MFEKEGNKRALEGMSFYQLQMRDEAEQAEWEASGEEDVTHRGGSMKYFRKAIGLQ